jgi:hypothetical protein
VKIRTVLEGIGAALLLVPFLPYIAPDHIALYLHGLPVTNLIGGVLLDMLAVSLLASGFLLAIQYLQRAAERILSALFAGLMLWRIADIAIQLSGMLQIESFWQEHLRKQSCVAIPLLSGMLACILPRIVTPAVRMVRLAIAALAFSALWIVPQLLYVALARPSTENATASHLPTPVVNGSSRRIVWILFDELSYDQTFDHQAAGMRLPNFGRLRAESVSFSNLRPTGFHTALIIPSLFLGRHIEQIRSTVAGDLWYKDEDQNRWLAFDPNATLFAFAQRNGWSTGVDGWYNPYCHILASVLNACSWEPSLGLPTELFGAAEQNSVLANGAVLPNALLAKLTNSSAAPEDAHVVEYRNVMARTQALIQNDHIRFVFLHLPVPHPPGIYNRQHHVLRPGGTYLDNLVLADDTLGALLKEIDATPAASRTTVIVSSDHSWRIPLWRLVPGWTAEEERASGGRFDDRPVLLIHFPGQISGNDVNPALPELLEHDIIAEMLRGKINSSKDLAAFLTSQGR